MNKSRLPHKKRMEALKKFKKGHGGFMTEREYHIFRAGFGMGWKERKKRLNEIISKEEVEKGWEKFLKGERIKFNKEKEKVKGKSNAFCKDGKHIFLVNRDKYGELLKTCIICPMTIMVLPKDY